MSKNLINFLRLYIMSKDEELEYGKQIMRPVWFMLLDILQQHLI